VNGPELRGILSRKISRQKRWDLVYKACSKVTRCGGKSLEGCGAKQPDKISREGVLRIAMEWKEVGGGADGEDVSHKQVMTAEDVLRILRRITDAEAEAMGFCPKFNRPEWMICTVLPVPPPAVRPSVRTEAGQRSEDDLTHKLNSIVKINNMLKTKIDRSTSAEQYDMLLQLLQYEVATLVDNNIPGLPQSHQRGRPIKSISDRLKSKEGRIRGNLMGKRVDFSARSVITPDPNISIEELGVPLKIAINMTFPEVVNTYNVEQLRGLVRAGPDTFPGAKFVIKTAEGARKIRLRGVDRDIIAMGLTLGDVVERHMRDGDYVLFNRQPSLHKMSMMAHRVRVMPYNTFRLNVCVTPGYNADWERKCLEAL
jgi:DNA-directed RNA polymerase II subunit RPB1